MPVCGKLATVCGRNGANSALGRLPRREPKPAEAANPTLAIAECSRYLQAALAAHFHACDPFIPSLDHLSSTELECVWLIAINRAVELPVVSQPARIMHGNPLARRRSGSRTYLDLPILKAVCRCDGIAGDGWWPSRLCLDKSDSKQQKEREACFFILL